jgi:hypothetical protein
VTWEGRTRRWMEGTAAETPPTAWLGLCDSVGGLREIVGRRVVGWLVWPTGSTTRAVR